MKAGRLYLRFFRNGYKVFQVSRNTRDGRVELDLIGVYVANELRWRGSAKSLPEDQQANLLEEVRSLVNDMEQNPKSHRSRVSKELGRVISRIELTIDRELSQETVDDLLLGILDLRQTAAKALEKQSRADSDT